MHDVEVKIERAWFHHDALNAEFSRRRDDGAYVFAPEVKGDGREHIYRAVDPPPVGRHWGAMLGESVHALRSALEHLAWQLVIANGGSPNGRTHFPIQKRRSSERIWRWSPYPKKRVPLRIKGGVTREAIDAIDEVQPYRGTDAGHRLWAISRLDNFDKHRELMVTVGRVHTAAAWGDGSTFPDHKVVFTQRPVEHDEVVARVVYAVPQAEPYPHLTFTPYITFGERSPYPKEIALSFMADLIGFVESDLVPRFYQWVPKARP